MTVTLHEQTRDYIVKLSDSELAEYAESPGLYEPAAIEFARAEFARRNIEPNASAVLQAQGKQAATAKEVAWAETPLTRVQKLLIFTCGFFFSSLIAIILLLCWWDAFRSRGQLRRARELWEYFAYGVGTLILLACVLFALSFVYKS